MTLPETLADAFDAVVEARPESLAVIDTRRPDLPGLTFSALAEEVARATSFLADRLDLERGDVLCNWLPNVPETIVLHLAAARLGLLTVSLNTRYRAAELAHVLKTTGPAALVLPTAFLGIDFVGIARAVLGADAREGWAEQWPTLRSVVAVDTSPGPHDSSPPGSGALTTLDWAAATAAYRGRDIPSAGVAGPDDPLIAFNTSGSTGMPKLAVHTHRSVVRHAGNVSRAFDLGPQDSLLMALPLCGAFGFTGAISAMLAGARLVLQPVFDADQAVAWFGREQITHAYGPDNLLCAILDAASDPGRLSSWRATAFANFSGDGPRVAERIEHELGIPARGVYGASELLALVSVWPPDADPADRHQNGGRPVSPDIQVRAVDPVDGTPLTHDQDGELQFRGYCVMSGYYGDEQASQAALTDDGWFRSGDLGRTRRDGSFIYVSRLGDSLRLGGFLVDPAEIEALLLTHPRVRAAAVVGVARPGSGDVAVAFVEADPATDTDSVLAWLKERTAAFKTPTHLIAVDTLPRVEGPNGVKVKRADLRRIAQDLLAPRSDG